VLLLANPQVNSRLPPGISQKFAASAGDSRCYPSVTLTTQGIGGKRVPEGYNRIQL
jgi:hypothetical protein